ncbi:hypothetical protein Peur_018369 [Populus x canadensis]
MPLIHDSDFRCVFHTFHKDWTRTCLVLLFREPVNGAFLFLFLFSLDGYRFQHRLKSRTPKVYKLVSCR